MDKTESWNNYWNHYSRTVSMINFWTTVFNWIHLRTLLSSFSFISNYIKTIFRNYEFRYFQVASHNCRGMYCLSSCCFLTHASDCIFGYAMIIEVKVICVKCLNISTSDCACFVAGSKRIRCCHCCCHCFCQCRRLVAVLVVAFVFCKKLL